MVWCLMIQCLLLSSILAFRPSIIRQCLLHATLVHIDLMLFSQMVLQGSFCILLLFAQILVAIVAVSSTTIFAQPHVDAVLGF